jgi:hypothetical protein
LKGKNVSPLKGVTMGILDWIKKLGKKVKKGWQTVKAKVLPVVGAIANKVAPVLGMIPGVGGIASGIASGIGKVATGLSQGGLKEGWKTAKQVWRATGASKVFSDQNPEYPQLSQAPAGEGGPVEIGEGGGEYTG